MLLKLCGSTVAEAGNLGSFGFLSKGTALGWVVLGWAEHLGLLASPEMDPPLCRWELRVDGAMGNDPPGPASVAFSKG